MTKKNKKNKKNKNEKLFGFISFQYLILLSICIILVATGSFLFNYHSAIKQANKRLNNNKEISK